MKTVALFAMAVVVALSQPVERVLPFTQLQTAQEFAEAATVIRSTGEIRELRVDAAQKTLIVRGERAQVELAEWLMARVDRTTAPAKAREEYPAGGGGDTVVRVLYFQKAATAQARNEMATMIRSLLEVRSLFVSMAAGALVLRCSPGQADGAEWVFAALEGTGESGSYRMAGGGDDMLRLLAVANGGTVEEFYRKATSVRAALQLRHLFTYTPGRVVAVRGTEELTGRAAEMLSAR